MVAYREEAVARAALDAVVELADERKKLNFDIILKALPEALATTILETHMQANQ